MSQPSQTVPTWRLSAQLAAVAEVASQAGIGDSCLISARVEDREGVALHVREHAGARALAAALELVPAEPHVTPTATHHYWRGTVALVGPVSVTWCQLAAERDELDGQGDDDAPPVAAARTCVHLDLVPDGGCEQCAAAADAACSRCGHTRHDHWGYLDNCHAVFEDGEPCGCGVE